MAKRLKKPSLCRGVLSIWSCKRHNLAKRFYVGLVALTLTACGFTPIYKYDGSQAQLELKALSVSGAAIERALGRELGRRIILKNEAHENAVIALKRQIIEMQKDSDGVARRFEVRHAAQLTLTTGAAGDETVVKDFALTQYMTRGDSAADELSQLRRLDDLAARDLAAQLIGFIASQLNAKEGR